MKSSCKLSSAITAVLILLATAISPLPGHAQNSSGNSHAENASRLNLDSVLNILNREIENVDTHRRQKETHISALRNALVKATQTPERFNIASELFDEYKAYQSDSAFHYASLMHRIANEGPEPNRTMTALSNIAFADYFISVGFFKEATEMLDMTDSALLSPEKKSEFYALYGRLYRSLCSYVGGEGSPLWPAYNNLYRAYLDSVLAISPHGSYDYDYAMIDRLQMDRPDRAASAEQRLTLLRRHQLPNHEKAINYSLLAHALIDSGKRGEAEYYLTLSAIHDILSNTTETTAATMLARMLHEDGRNDDAYRYITKALDDATFYNTRLRKYEISGLMPEIDSARYHGIYVRMWRLVAVIGFIVFLLILSVVLFFMLHKKKRALERTNAELDKKSKEIALSHAKLTEANALLNQTLAQLRETTEIKDRYIMQSLLYVNTAFVNQVEEKCREVVKAVKDKKYDELKFLPYQMGIKEERQRIYRSFDTAFLKLFPNFIDELNKLFDEENRIVLAPDQELPMEVRIFALMRLGITDPAEVANYLNLSTKTVYVYKTKLKSRANIDNSEFEKLVIAIPKP